MKKIFTKADEMELAINYKAARNAFVFLEFALAIYCLVCVLKTGELPWVYCFRCGILGDETDRNKTTYRSGGFR